MKGEYKYRLKYAKTENARYISHLDFVRVLNRTIRRSGLPVTYTEGFNPHPVMVVALPLGVGITGEDEYIDIDFDEKIEPSVVCNTFREAFPEGIEVSDAVLVDESLPSFKNLDSAKYICEIETSGVLKLDLDGFLSQDEIIVSKKSKSATKDVDIKNDIKEIEILESKENYFKLSITLPAGNTYNLKPDLVFSALARYQGFELVFVKSHRVCVYANGNRFI